MKRLLEKLHLKPYQLIILILFFTITFILTTRLFYYQAIDKYYSDLFVHIDEAVNKTGESYSLVSIIYSFLYNKLGGIIPICIFLSLINIATIIATKKLLELFIDKKDNHFLLWIYAIILNFIHPIILPFVANGKGQWTVPYQVATVWHNSTYQCMKLFAVMCMHIYYIIQKNYLEKIRVSHFIIFTALLTLTNFVKPNFILAFAPTLAFYLAIDFFKNLKNRKSIINIFLLGFGVLISLSVLLFQSTVLYGENSPTGNNGIEFGFMVVLQHFHKYPILSIFQSAAFPFFIILTNFKTIIKNRMYSFSVVMYIIALLMYLFLNETGARIYHGNFNWTIAFAVMMLFTIALCTFHNTKNKDRKYKKLYLLCSYGLLSAHFIIGIIFFIRLNLGLTFF